MSFILNAIRRELDLFALNTSIFFLEDSAKVDYALVIDEDEPQGDGRRMKVSKDLLLSNMGSSLVDFYENGVPTPAAFIISTEYSIEYNTNKHISEEEKTHDSNFFDRALPSAIVRLERKCNQRFGEIEEGKFPLMLAIRVGTPLELGSKAQQSSSLIHTSKPPGIYTEPPLSMPDSRDRLHSSINFLADFNNNNNSSTSADSVGGGGSDSSLSSTYFPGIQETVLFVGLNDAIVAHLGQFITMKKALSMQCNFLMTFGSIIFGKREAYLKVLRDLVSSANSNGNGSKECPDLTTIELRSIISEFKKIQEIPDDAFEQVRVIIKSAYSKWFSSDAIEFRRAFLQDGLRDNSAPALSIAIDAKDLGVAIILQKIEFGSSGVVRSRDDNGRRKLTGEFQSSFSTTKSSLRDFQLTEESSYNRLRELVGSLEEFFKDMVQVEFVLDEEGRVFILRCENCRRSSASALQVATNMCFESIINEVEAIERIDVRKLQKDESFSAYDVMKGNDPNLSLIALWSSKFVKQDVYSIISSKKSDEELDFLSKNPAYLGEGIVLKTDYMFDSISEVKHLVRQIFFSPHECSANAKEKLILYQKEEIKRVLRLKSRSGSPKENHNHTGDGYPTTGRVLIQLLDDPFCLSDSFPSSESDVIHVATSENFCVSHMKSALKKWNFRDLSTDGIKGSRLIDLLSFIFDLQIRAILLAQNELRVNEKLETDVHVLFSWVSNQSELDHFSLKLLKIINTIKSEEENRDLALQRYKESDAVQDHCLQIENCDVNSAAATLNIGLVGNNAAFCFTKTLCSNFPELKLTTTMLELNTITSSFFGCQKPYDCVFSYSSSGGGDSSGGGGGGSDLVVGNRGSSVCGSSEGLFAIIEQCIKQTRYQNQPALLSGQDSSSGSSLVSTLSGLFDLDLVLKSNSNSVERSTSGGGGSSIIEAPKRHCVGAEFLSAVDYPTLRLLCNCGADFIACPLGQVEHVKIMLAQIELNTKKV